MKKTSKNFLDYLLPDEKEIFKSVQDRVKKNSEIIPKLYRFNRLNIHKDKLIKQMENDKYTISVLQTKALARKDIEERISQKVSLRATEEEQTEQETVK